MSHGKKFDQHPASLQKPAGRRIAGRAQMEEHGDPYRAEAKPAEPSACPDCGAVFHRGRWQWIAAPADARPMRCPACCRIRDAMPAGIVSLSGEYVRSHRDELLHNIRAQEQAERAEHPLNRIMAIVDPADGDRIEVTTTDIHLPRRIGESIERANGGRLRETYDEDGYFVRVDWHRDD